MAVVNLTMTKSIKSLIILAEGRNQMNVCKINYLYVSNNIVLSSLGWAKQDLWGFGAALLEEKKGLTNYS